MAGDNSSVMFHHKLTVSLSFSKFSRTMVTIVLSCFFLLLLPDAPFVSWGTQPLLILGMLNTKVNKGYTVIAQPGHRVEVSYQPPVGVHSRLMGSKKALRNRGNFRNSKTTNS